MTKEEWTELQAAVAQVSQSDVAMGRVINLLVSHLEQLSPPPAEAPEPEAAPEEASPPAEASEAPAEPAPAGQEGA